MGGEGNILHMIQTLKNNRRLKKSIRRKFKNGEIVESTHKDWQLYKPDVTEKEMEEIIEKIRLKVQRQNKVYSYMRFVLFAILIAVIAYFWKYLF